MDEITKLLLAEDSFTVTCCFKSSHNDAYEDWFLRVAKRLSILFADLVCHLQYALKNLFVIFLALVVQAVCVVLRNFDRIFFNSERYLWHFGPSPLSVCPVRDSASPWINSISRLFGVSSVKLVKLLRTVCPGVDRATGRCQDPNPSLYSADTYKMPDRSEI